MLPPTGANVSGADTDTLTISDVLTTNGTTGAYYLVASNPYGSKTSSIVTVTAVGPPAVSIGFLRTLVDPTTYNATKRHTAVASYRHCHSFHQFDDRRHVVLLPARRDCRVTSCDSWT